MVHDELKDKTFELEMSWIGKGCWFNFTDQFFSWNAWIILNDVLTAETNGLHEFVPEDVLQEAITYAKVGLESCTLCSEDVLIFATLIFTISVIIARLGLRGGNVTDNQKALQGGN